jgi:flagellar hook-associated protein 2
LAELLGEATSSSATSTAGSDAIQTAVNSILNSATGTSGSGIDVTSTVDSILQIDAQPEISLDSNVSALNSQTSALQSLQADITAFQTSLQSLTDFTGDFGGLAVSSSNNNVVSATAADGTEAGTHVVTVSGLASTSADYSAAFSSPIAELPTGTLTIAVGSNHGTPVNVDSADGTNTPTGLANYINSNNLGVTASVITDNTGSRLALVSQTSGLAGQITLTDNTAGNPPATDESTIFASPTTALPTGSFQIQVASNAPVTIPVDTADGTDTLTGLANYLNQQNLGVTASVETTTAGSVLAIVPQAAGAAGVIHISNDTTGKGNGFGFPATFIPTTPPPNGGLGFVVAQPGQDAGLTVDGIPIDSGSNTVTGAIQGVTLTLSGVTSTTPGQPGTPVTLQISPNLSPIATDVNNFVSSWNTLIGAINSTIQVSDSSSGGALTGDTTIAFVQQQLLGSISSSMPGADNTSLNLQSIGIELQNDGTLNVDSTALTNALENNFSTVQNLFQATSGVGQTIQNNLTLLTDPTTGALNVDMNGITNQITALNSQISDFQLQLQQTQQQLVTEYSTINTTLEQLPETLAQINSQLNALNPPNSQTS